MNKKWITTCLVLLSVIFIAGCGPKETPTVEQEPTSPPEEPTITPEEPSPALECHNFQVFDEGANFGPEFVYELIHFYSVATTDLKIDVIDDMPGLWIDDEGLKFTPTTEAAQFQVVVTAHGGLPLVIRAMDENENVIDLYTSPGDGSTNHFIFDSPDIEYIMFEDGHNESYLLEFCAVMESHPLINSTCPNFIGFLPDTNFGSFVEINNVKFSQLGTNDLIVGNNHVGVSGLKVDHPGVNAKLPGLFSSAKVLTWSDQTETIEIIARDLYNNILQQEEVQGTGENQWTVLEGTNINFVDVIGGGDSGLLLDICWDLD